MRRMSSAQKATHRRGSYCRRLLQPRGGPMLLSILLPRSRVRGATIMLAGLVVGATLIVPVSPEAYAATGGDGCNPNSNGSRPDNYRHYYFVNAQDGPSISEGGIQADIFNYSPWVYRTDPGVTAWVALGDATTGSLRPDRLVGVTWECPVYVRTILGRTWQPLLEQPRSSSRS